MMGNVLFLKQARDGIKRLIDESPSTITINRRGLVDDGAGDGVLVENPYDNTPDEYEMTVRISHERRQAPEYGEVQAGFSTNLNRFIMTKHTDLIYAGDTFYDSGTAKYFRIGPVDPLKKFNAIIAYQAPLTESEEINGDT